MCLTTDAVLVFTFAIPFNIYRSPKIFTLRRFAPFKQASENAPYILYSIP